VDEAIAAGVQMLISHHPLPFKPVSRIVSDDESGRVLLALASHQIALYCPHTSWDSSRYGINAQLAGRLSLDAVRPLQWLPGTEDMTVGTGRAGTLSAPQSLIEFAESIRRELPNTRLRVVGRDSAMVSNVGVACGSAGSMLGLAAKANCDTFVTGEATYHQCLDARSKNLTMFLIGHFASERFAMESMAGLLAKRFSTIESFSSACESDPVRTI
jgi:dinuclear metal center YbgI/SA1388 family protein